MAGGFAAGMSRDQRIMARSLNGEPRVAHVIQLFSRAGAFQSLTFFVGAPWMKATCSLVIPPKTFCPRNCLADDRDPIAPADAE